MKPDLAKFLSGRGLPLVRELATARGVDAYVVGGCLRDLFLGREGRDIDIALSGGWREIPRDFAERTHGSFFWLDEERGHARVITRNLPDAATFDFAPLRGTGIVEDLTLRDFTINSLAVSLATEIVLLDPLEGETDIHRRIVRMCADRAFADDPLRLVRAFRFAAVLGFPIDDATRAAIPTHAAYLSNVSGERIRDELFQALQPDGAGRMLQEMAVAGVFGSIVPWKEGQPTHVVLQEGSERITRLEVLSSSLDALLGDHACTVSERLSGEIQQGITRLALMKLASWLSCLGIEPETASGRLKHGKAAQALLKIFCRLDTAAFRETEDDHYLRKRYRFFDEREPGGPELPLLALANGLIAERLCREFVTYWMESYIPRGKALLLNGDEIISLLHIPRGKAVGAALEMLRESQTMGLVCNRDAAVAFLRKKQLTTEEPMG
ncbi:tRNA nucleotidyltransferase/poly(A) polymerase family protein [Geobacter pickeringii]|uniref:Polya polymerase n=1 Tax=Geobacter pickeringii TaxID=345632 RepID=A0A0B5BES8_9BACT|nr:CCA tRNA nucleotidyltransferase [Geobacter pickeringii]AJE03659.1 hypothetical protein GPICK_10135 [Geobacter pickeringii]